MLKIPRIFSCAVERSFVGRTHGKLVHVGAAERYHAFVEQVLDDGGCVGGDEVVQHFGAACAAPAGLAENILVGDGYAGKRGGVALSDTFVCGTGFCKGFILVDGDIAVEGGIFFGDGGKVCACQFDGGNLFGLQQDACLFQCVLCHKSSIPKGFQAVFLMPSEAYSDYSSITCGTIYRRLRTSGATA